MNGKNNGTDYNKLSGIIVVDKPAGWTSHDVVAKLRGALHVKRIGHGGTLDPMATGVLPVFVGRATGAVSFFESTDKEYIAGLRLGIVTDTQDTTGNVLDSFDVNVTDADLRKIIPRFLGPQKQIPPMYSAVKIGGKKLYQLARRGVEIERPPRDIVIHSIELLDIEESCGDTLDAARDVTPGDTLDTARDVTLGDTVNNRRIIPQSISDENCHGDYPHDYLLRISCSKGTYIRTLCNDIGAALGCGGAMSSLRRTKAGVYTTNDAHTLDVILDAAASGTSASISANYATVADTSASISANKAAASGHNSTTSGGDNATASGDNVSAADENAAAAGDADIAKDVKSLRSFFIPVDTLFSEYPTIILDEETTRKCRNGMACRFTSSPDGIYRFYSPHNEFILLARIENGTSRIIKTFFEV